MVYFALNGYEYQWCRFLNDKELTIFGYRQKPEKIYRTCTFANLGSKKNEFLDRVIRAFEADGFKRLPPVESFKLSLGAKDAVKFWDWSWRDKVAYHEMAGSDVLLGADKKGTKYIVGFRVEARNNDLRFGYFRFRKIEPKSAAGMKFFLAIGLLLAYTIVAIIIDWFLAIFLITTLGLNLWISVITVSVALFLPIVPFFIYYGFIKPKRMLIKTDQHISEIAESMGSKQITPFKKTTVKLED